MRITYTVGKYFGGNRCYGTLGEALRARQENESIFKEVVEGPKRRQTLIVARDGVKGRRLLLKTAAKMLALRF